MVSGRFLSLFGYLFVLLCAAVQAQVPPTAEAQVRYLHEGILLVRLPTRQASLKALHDRGAHALAEKEAQAQQEANDVLMRAFRDHFQFCPVYFFSSDQSERVRQARLHDLVLQGDSSLRLQPQPFLVAELAQASHVYPPGPTAFHFEALFLEDHQFRPLTAPFPFRVRTFRVRTFRTLFFLHRSPAQAVRLLNERLHKFYEKSTR
ncbi:hypothetical protein SAMN05421823_101149 [Catalinimonas alkaloidigena]|uniref:Uncharacterized protein n=1 Tax=Catalinimonas alkaloidigena TaxID=1075417 RepID=A0A1G8WPM3_9BACT|nr:hypothetical protein [Catalinimonas alkaloidigena]SDJ80308.1 hypothetical protein SAMN05421823_101149 [Catalinimonas alkaloidigena]